MDGVSARQCVHPAETRISIMIIDVMPHKSLTAEMMGSTAHRLYSTHHHGKVFTSVSDTIYMLSYDGNLFWITSEKIPLHGRSICVKGKVPQIEPGTSYTILEDKIHFENGVEIDLSSSAQIQLGILALQDLLPLSSLFNKTEKIYLALSKFPLKGFGEFIPNILANVQHLPLSEEFAVQDPILQFAWPMFRKTIQECLKQNMPMALDSAEGLVGLGSGLTPSGDDFLGGMFFIFNFLRINYTASFVFDLNRISEFIDRNKEKTNLISLTMLKDLANGQAPAPLYEFVNSLMDHQPIDSSINSASLMTQIGHSTGWDMLTGVLVGLLCTRHYSVGHENHS
jgi:hypothetical protein